MKRRNTACREMIEEVATFRKDGIKNFICTADYYTESGKHKTLNPVMKHTAQGISAYANAMYNKYGDTVTVEVGYFDNNCKWHTYTTYHA